MTDLATAPDRLDPAILAGVMDRLREMAGANARPPGKVIVMCAEAPRHADFWMNALGPLVAAMPTGSSVGGMPGVELARNLNVTVEVALREGAEWVWITGDDHLFAPDIIDRLLDTGKDIVVPNCLHRGATPRPCVFDEHAVRTDGKPGPGWTMRNVDGAAGLIQVDGAGSAGMLIRKRVFAEVPKPWFEIGRIETDLLGEDLWFCRKARDAGFDVWCDLDIPFGHKTPVTMYAHRTEDGRWTTRYSFPNGHEMVESL